MRSLLYSRALKAPVLPILGIVLGGLLASCGGGGGSAPVPPVSQQPTTTSPAAAQPEQSTTAASSTYTTIHITQADRAAVATAKARLAHIFKTSSATSTSSTARKTQTLVVPSDLDFFGGRVITTATVFNAYVNSQPGIAGQVVQFENNYSLSSLIHMTDQYVGTTANNRYPSGGSSTIAYPAVANLGDNDLLLIVHAFARTIGPGGYHHIYHIFLPKTIHYCSTGNILPTGLCDASGPNPGFCAFHDSVVFSDIGETIFSLEPFIPLNGCNINAFTANPNQPTPNGPQQDSAYSALSHEETEIITDPDPGTGWVNPVPFYPGEIGDLCAYDTGPFVNGFTSGENTNLNGKLYRIQFEYSNKQHGCNNSPP